MHLPAAVPQGWFLLAKSLGTQDAFHTWLGHWYLKRMVRNAQPHSVAAKPISNQLNNQKLAWNINLISWVLSCWSGNRMHKAQTINHPCSAWSWLRDGNHQLGEMLKCMGFCLCQPQVPRGFCSSTVRASSAFPQCNEGHLCGISDESHCRIGEGHRNRHPKQAS